MFTELCSNSVVVSTDGATDQHERHINTSKTTFAPHTQMSDGDREEDDWTMDNVVTVDLPSDFFTSTLSYEQLWHISMLWWVTLFGFVQAADAMCYYCHILYRHHKSNRCIISTSRSLLIGFVAIIFYADDFFNHSKVRGDLVSECDDYKLQFYLFS